MDYIKKSWRLLAEFSGVWSTLLMLLLASRWFVLYYISSFSKNIYLGILLTILVLLSIVFLLFYAYNNILKIKNSWKKEVINKELSEKKASEEGLSLSRYTPKNKFFANVWESAVSEAVENWSKDASVSSFNFYMNKQSDNIIKSSVQVIFFSNWKNEQLTIYFPTMGDSNYKGLTEFDKRSELKKPFYAIDNWEIALNRSVEQINTIITNGFRLQISSRGDKVSFTFTFMMGKREETRMFIFNGENLENTANKTTVLIRKS